MSLELLGEMTNPQEVQAYDHLECTFYESSGSDRETIFNGKYEVRLSLTSESKDVSVKGIFTDENSEPLGREFEQTYQNIKGLVHNGDFKFSKPIARDKIYLSLTALYTSQDSPQIPTAFLVQIQQTLIRMHISQKKTKPSQNQRCQAAVTACELIYSRYRFC
jgi:hypothetical protein